MKKRLWLICMVMVLALLSTQIVFAQTTHTIQSGETLFRIAQQYGITLDALASANNIVNYDRVYAGQVLLIPDGSAPAASAAPVAAASTYVVRPGDTLAQIALNHGITLAALVNANGIQNVNIVYVGQVLTIPAGGQSSGIIAAPTLGVNHGGAKWIDVDLSEQLLVAYEGDTPVYSTYISSGLAEFPTVIGQFNVWLRYESQTMNGYALGYDYYIENVPYVMYFFEDYAIHGAYWHNNFGTPMSHGCVNTSPGAAEWLFNWSEYGTLVNVHQ